MKGRRTPAVFLTAREDKLSFEQHVALFNLLFVVLCKDSEACQDLLFDVAVEVLAPTLEALVKESQRQELLGASMSL